MAGRGAQQAGRRARFSVALVTMLAVAFAATTLSASNVTAGASSVQRLSPRTARTPKQWDRRIAPIAHAVEHLRNLTFDHPVVVRFLPASEFEEALARGLNRATAAQKQQDEAAEIELRAVGFLGPDVHLVEVARTFEKLGVLAYYDDDTKIVSVKGTALDDIATKVTVAHELTHALQDQHYDLVALGRRAAKGHWLTALHTLIEGDAVRIQRDYVKSLPIASQNAYMEEANAQFAQARLDAQLAGVPTSITSLFEAPYFLGPLALDAVIAKRSVAAVDKLFAHPPTNDSAYLTPSTLLDGSRFLHVAAPTLAAGEEGVGTPDTFGAIALYLMLATQLDPASALAAADGWGGDSMTAFTSGGKDCLRGAFVGRDDKKTAAIGDALSMWAALMPEGAANVVAAEDDSRVVLTACDPGVVDDSDLTFSALLMATERDDTFRTMLTLHAPVPVAVCTSDRVVQDPTFSPILQSLTTDPAALPDPESMSAFQLRFTDLYGECARRREREADDLRRNDV